jgi:hypothetical protein
MAVKEFRDSGGRGWRAWDVRLEDLREPARYELPGEYQDGWLAFESSDGEVRKRLAIYPEDWATLAVPELEALIRKAELVSLPKPRPAGPARAPGRGAPRMRGGAGA